MSLFSFGNKSRSGGNVAEMYSGFNEVSRERSDNRKTGAKVNAAMINDAETKRLERELLKIPTPLQKYMEKNPGISAQDVADWMMPNLQNNQSRRILSVLSDNNSVVRSDELIFTREAFNYPHATGRDLIKLVQQFPSPMTVEPLVEKFIADKIGIVGGDAKGIAAKKAQYRESAVELMKFAYGDRYDEYVKRKKAMAQGGKVNKGRWIDRFTRGDKGAKVEQDARVETFGNRLHEGKVGYASVSHTERNRFLNDFNETVGRNAGGRLSKGEFDKFCGKYHEVADSCEDNMVVVGNVFAVFDGVGGEGHSRAKAASALAAQEIGAVARSRSVNGAEDLVSALNSASETLKANPEAGYTTGVIACIKDLPNGKKKLIGASIGDSRMYLLRRGANRVELLTHDEEVIAGDKKFLANALGADDPDSPDLGKVTDRNMFEIDVRAGDRVLLCTDGLHGSTDAQNIDDRIYSCLKKSPNAQVATVELLRASKKMSDDCTAVVVEV